MTAVSELIHQAMTHLTTPENPDSRESDCTRHGPYAARVLTRIPGKHGEPDRPVWSRCPGCDSADKEREQAERRADDAKERQQRLEQAISRAGIPRRFADRSFESFEAADDAQLHALETARDFAERFEDHAKHGTVLVFSGNIGTGKGHLAIAAARHVLASGYTAMFASAREIVLMLRESWNGSANAPSELQVLRRLCAVDLLIIDEVGVQFGTDAERDQLFGVIDGRYRDCMPMIITTNLGTGKLKDTLGERSFSRLREGGTWVSFAWDDHRPKKRGKEAP